MVCLVRKSFDGLALPTVLCFGAGTLPNLWGIGLLAGAAARLAERPWLRQGAGLLVIAFGIHALWQLNPMIWGSGL